MHQQWDKKATVKKRTGEASGGSEDAKKPRLETLPDTSNTSAASGSGSSRTSGLAFSHSAASGSGPPPAYPGTSHQHQDNRFANQQ